MVSAEAVKKGSGSGLSVSEVHGPYTKRMDLAFSFI